MNKCYIAGPFFNERQLEILQLVKTVLNERGLDYYSPKDECLFKEGMDASTIFNDNIDAIHSCSHMIVITDGKDIGTMFEAGYAYSFGLPIVYLWVDHGDSPLNLMLSQSGSCICLGMDSFEDTMKYFALNNILLKKDYEGAQQ